MIYIKLVLILLWFIASAIAGFFLLPFRWGDLNLNATYARMFAWGMLRIAGIQVDLENPEALEAHQPCIYVGNHQSGFDIATFGSCFPRQTVVIGKKEIIWIPFFGALFAAAGNIMINRQKRVSAIAGLDQTIQRAMKQRASVFIFPEGTRNRTTDPLIPFKKGAFHMAIKSGYPIVPVVCSRLDTLISWKEKKISSGRVRIRVLPPISTKEMTDADISRLSKMTWDAMQEAILGLGHASSVKNGMKQSVKS